MLNLMNLIKSIKKIKALLLLCFVLNFSSKAHAGIDTTLFRINVVQDSVSAGDTVDVDFFIGGTGLLGGLNILKEFEIEVVSDTSLFNQNNIQFKLDSTSLESFFGTLISNITTITTIDPILGKLGVKTNSTSIGSGNARVGRAKYIVQDNIAGRQYMHYDFTKAISKDLLGFNNPVKVITDSVLIVNRVQATTVIRTFAKNYEIRISPNPVIDFLHIEGVKIQQYKLLDINGIEMKSGFSMTPENIPINLNKLPKGIYILLLQINNNWNSYKIIKE